MSRDRCQLCPEIRHPQLHSRETPSDQRKRATSGGVSSLAFVRLDFASTPWVPRSPRAGIQGVQTGPVS